MTRAEELADKYGITEPHDENCQGDGLCREHFIEKLEEAFKKCDSGEYRGGLVLLDFRIPGGPVSGDVDVSLIQHEEQKARSDSFALPAKEARSGPQSCG